MSEPPNLDGARDLPNPRLKLETGASEPVPVSGAAYGADSGMLAEVHLLDYVKVLYKRRWMVATVFTVVVLGATVYTFTATPIFEARAKLLIEAENPNVISFKEVIEEGQTRTDYYQTQYNLLQSRSLARRTLDGLRLWDRPEFAGAPAEPSFSLTGGVRGAVSWVAGWFGGGDTAPSKGSPEEAETGAESRAIDALLRNVTISPVRNSRIVDLRFRSPDAALATKVVNAHARNFIEQNLEYKFLASKEASDWLAARLAEERRKLEDSESALQRYREQNEAVSLEDHQNIVVQKLVDLNAAVTRAKTDRIEKDALYNQLKGIQNDRAALDTFPAILANSFIQQQKAELSGLQRQQVELSEKLGDRHPGMIKIRSAIQIAEAKLHGEIAKVVQSVRNEYLSAVAQEQSLTAALDAQKQEALALNRRAITYGVLQRDVESNKQIYESLLQRAKETGVSGELKTSNIRIVDAAEVPRKPVSPQRTFNLLLAFLGGGVLAIGLAFFFEYLDNRIKTPDEIKAYLGLPCLGIIPSVSPKDQQGPAPLLNNGVPANFTEAFRVVRSNVLFSSAEEGSRSVVVTSCGPSEGKTVVSGNLAIGLARAGERVLLIDADMRRPQIHELFGLPLEPGLSNLLVGNAKAKDVVLKSAVPGLWLLPAGRIPPNAAELLGSQRFKDFLASLGQHFSWVILDSPPVMAVTDSSVVAHLTSGVLFVVGAEMTSRPAAQIALEQLSAARARLIGAVLNRVDLERNAYYYSQYYRREYSRYYTK